MVFKYALRHRLIAENPAVGTVLPRVRHEQKFEPLFLTAQEVEALALHLSEHAPDDLFVRLAAYTGLRAGEMLGLQVRDINLLRHILDVRRTYQHTRDGWAESSPKSDKSIRTVPLRRVLVYDLTEYLAEHPHRDDPTAPLWPGRSLRAAASGGAGSTGISAWTTTRSIGGDSVRQPRRSVARHCDSTICATPQRACSRRAGCRWRG